MEVLSLFKDQGTHLDPEGTAWRVLSLLGDQFRLCLSAPEARAQVHVYSRRGPPRRRLAPAPAGYPAGPQSGFQRDQDALAGGLLLAPRRVEALRKELTPLCHRGNGEASAWADLFGRRTSGAICEYINACISSYLSEPVLEMMRAAKGRRPPGRLPIDEYTRLFSQQEEISQVGELAPALLPLAKYLGGFMAMRQRMNALGLTKQAWKYLNRQEDGMIRLLVANFQDAHIVTTLNRCAALAARSDMREVTDKTWLGFLARTQWSTLRQREWEGYGELVSRLVLQEMQAKAEDPLALEDFLAGPLVSLEAYLRDAEVTFSRAEQKQLALPALLRRADDFFELLREEEQAQAALLFEAARAKAHGAEDDNVRWASPFDHTGKRVDGYLFEPLTCFNDQKAESREMNHCVGRGGYGQNYKIACVQGRARLYKVIGPNGRATLEVGKRGRDGEGWSIRQLQGRSNGNPGAPLRAAADCFVRQHFQPEMNRMIQEGGLQVEYEISDGRWMTLDDMAMETAREYTVAELVERAKARREAIVDEAPAPAPPPPGQ